MNTTLRAAVHLGKDYDLNLRHVKNHLWKTAGQLVRETEKLVRGQTENHWQKHDKCPRFEVDVNKLLNPGRSKSNRIRTTIFQRIESN